jgi:two-component system OmpR family sensor kinase
VSPPFLSKREHAELRRYRRFRRRGPKRLQQQIFAGFGIAIFTTMLTSALMFSVLGAAVVHKPWLRLCVFFLAGSVLWSFSGMLARRLAWPLWELARAAKDFGSGDLRRRARVPARAPSEVNELAGAFNDMAARIEAQVRSQRELLGAVSHELRTPLARLRVLLAMLQDSAQQPELAAKFEREVLEMDALVGELLAEARIAASALHARRLDLPDVLRACLERLDLADVALHVPEDCRALEADPTLLARALTILLDNARKHGGDRVSVRVERVSNALRIAVEDDGPGFDPGDFAQVFEPFTRGRGALADEQRGVGLGLYLVRRIAQAHGGDAFAENRPTGGARVGISLPLTLAPELKTSHLSPA